MGEAGLDPGQIRVLVADDEPITRRVLEMHLRRWGYDVLAVDDGAKARQALQEHPDIRLLVTDRHLPGCDGEDLCRFARSLERPRYLHVIMLAGRSEKRDLVSAMQAGADAFLIKPVEPPELDAQIRVARRVLELDEVNSRRVEELDAVNRRIQRDLEAAARVQHSFLPAPVVSLPGVLCASLFESSRHVAGDMYNVLPLEDGRVAAYVLDVSGHGTQAALLSVSVHLFLDSLRFRRPLGAEEDLDLEDPVAVIRALNRRFPAMGQSGQYFTVVYGVLDPARETFHYCRAGHPWPMLAGPSGVGLLEGAAGPGLGIFPELKLVPETVALAPGDLVLLYSDGLVEARSARDPQDEFGTERVLEVLREHRSRGVVACVDALRSGLVEFTGGQPPRDDVTILGLELE